MKLSLLKSLREQANFSDRYEEVQNAYSVMSPKLDKKTDKVLAAAMDALHNAMDADDSSTVDKALDNFEALVKKAGNEREGK